MRKFSAALMIIMMLCPCACASISRETVESAWSRICEADGFGKIPLHYENDESPNAWVSYRSQNDFSIHVTSGLMEILSTEDEIAGVLGHEIGHVRRGHYTRKAVRSAGWKAAGNLLGGIGGIEGTASRTAAGVGMSLAESGFSRGQEVEADDYGTELLSKAGYDPYGLYSAMKAFWDNDYVTQPGGFNSHPPTERRLKHLFAKAGEINSHISAENTAVKKQSAKVVSDKRKTSGPTSSGTAAENFSFAQPVPVSVRRIETRRLTSARSEAPEIPSSLPVSERLSVSPGGVVLQGARSYRGAVMSAYQRAYAMNFEIWKPVDLPAGWYATFDGFPVAQISENRWVYGQLNTQGIIMPTNILVGSVIPARVPGLARIAAVWSWGKNLSSPEFLRIRDTRVNRMGWLNTEYVNTLIAWNKYKPDVYIWLGDRWKRFEPNVGEYTYQMIKRLSPWIASELHKNNAWMYGGEPLEAADLARQWGLMWAGRVVLESLRNSGKNWNGGSHRDSGTTTSLHSDSGSQSESAPQEPTRDEGQWDVD